MKESVVILNEYILLRKNLLLLYSANYNPTDSLDEKLKECQIFHKADTFFEINIHSIYNSSNTQLKFFR